MGSGTVPPRHLVTKKRVLTTTFKWEKLTYFCVGSTVHRHPPSGGFPTLRGSERNNVSSSRYFGRGRNCPSKEQDCSTAARAITIEHDFWRGKNAAYL